MKIGYTAFQQPIIPKQDKHEKVPAAEGNVVQQMADSKKALKETVQQQLAEIEEARTDMGEDDPKAQRLIEKFKNGKKLTCKVTVKDGAELSPTSLYMSVGETRKLTVSNLAGRTVA